MYRKCCQGVGGSIIQGSHWTEKYWKYIKLEGTVPYGCLLLAPAEGLWPFGCLEGPSGPPYPTFLPPGNSRGTSGKCKKNLSLFWPGRNKTWAFFSRVGTKVDVKNVTKGRGGERRGRKQRGGKRRGTEGRGGERNRVGPGSVFY